MSTASTNLHADGIMADDTSLYISCRTTGPTQASCSSALRSTPYALLPPLDVSSHLLPSVLQERASDYNRPDAMAGNLDDFIGTSANQYIPVAVDVRRIARVIHVGNLLPVVAAIPLGLAPERRRESGKRPPDRHDALLARRTRLPLHRHDRCIDPGKRNRGGARLDRQQLDAVPIAKNRTTG